MIQIEDTLISDDLIEKDFVCHLEKCKGACCVKGDSGAPLTEEEVETLEKLLPKIKPFMNPLYAEKVALHGFFEKDKEGDWATTCQPTGECDFVVYRKGIACCSIEDAYNAKAIDFKKPISCHLYPVRLKQYENFVAVNYHSWEICNPACNLGKELGVPVYSFLKEPLIRRFGPEWYAALEAYYEETLKADK